MTCINVLGMQLEVLRVHSVAPVADRAPLLFLHEGLGSVALWRDWPQQLCDQTGRSGWVFSRRGYGGSETIADVRGPRRQQNGKWVGRLPVDYMHTEAWSTLPALCAVLTLQQPVLIGHSDGASIALLHASRHPVTACALLAPHVVVEDMAVTAIARARSAFVEGDLRERLARYHADVDCAFWQWNDIWLDPAFRSFDIRSDCRTIQAPVLALQGRNDPYGSAAQIEQIAAPRIERVLLPDCGHNPHREQAEQTTRLITQFLANVA